LEEEEHSLRESVSAYESLMSSRNELLELLSVLKAADALMGKQGQGAAAAAAALAPPKSKVFHSSSTIPKCLFFTLFSFVFCYVQAKASKRFTVEDHDPESLNSPLLSPGESFCWLLLPM
jgi:hypothetical protein